MNGRVYDPLTAQFFSPDPYVQAPGSWLNYNRYGYCYGNPFKYTDPSGEWIHFVVGAVVGGVINWVSNGCEFTWEGLTYFGAGAVAGLITAAAPNAYVAVSAGLSATNNLVQQSYDPNIGIKNVNFGQVLFQGIIGGTTSYVGSEFGKALQVDKWVSEISSPILRYLAQNTITNTIVGGVFGGFSALANGDNFFEGVENGAKMGIVTGAISGIGGATQYSIENKVSILTGKAVTPANQTTVLGHYPEYTNLADELNANRFSIPSEQWNAMSVEERWSINRQFLDEAISHSDQFRLATPINQVRPGSYYQKELNYMYKQGYKISPNGLWLIR
jgi:hypothetical protein